MEEKKDKLYNILWKNEENLLSPNANTIVIIVIIKKVIE